MKKTFLLATFLFAAVLTKAQTFPAAWSTRFQTVLDSLTHQPGLRTLTNQDTIGISMAVNIPGIGSWQGTSGPALPGTPLTSNMLMGIGSVTKLYTTVILLKMQEAGVLSLNDHIGKWIQVPLHDVDTSATIRQCLQHETGIMDFKNDRPSWVYDLFSDTGAVWTYTRMADSLGAPHFSPGKGFRYSNTNYTLCAWIIELASGNSLAQNLRQYITIPLGLTQTFESFGDSVALSAAPKSYSEVWGVWYKGLGSKAMASMSRGEGGLLCTPRDVAAFYQAVFNGSFLTPASKNQLLAIEPASQYGLGIWSYYSTSMQRALLTHTGTISGYHTDAFFDPLTGASVVWVCNSLDGNFNAYRTAIRTAFKNHFPLKATDAGVSQIIVPQGTICNTSLAPSISLKNYGSSPLTSVTIGYRIDGGSATTYAWTGNLASGASAAITLPTGNASNGTHTLTAWTQSPNGSTEGYALNDTIRNSFRVSTTAVATGYFSENFEGPVPSVLTWHRNNITQGQQGVTKLAGASGNHSLARNSYDNSNFGDVSFADMPLVRLTAGTAPVLTFKYAYSTYPGSADSLQALISADCGATWTSLFYKGGLDLSHGDSTYDGYFPRTAAQWRTASIPLSAYSGDVLIRFRQVNGWSNNTFLDDIAIGTPTSVTPIVGPVMAVYPNPASTCITITGLPDGTSIRLTDLTGRTLLNLTTKNSKTLLDLSTINPGIYLISSPYGSEKLVKQ